jgi:hypothetical protein
MSKTDAHMSNEDAIEEGKGSDSDIDILNRSLDSDISKRGRPLIPNSWTRVMLIEKMDISSSKIYPISTDLLLENAMPYVPPKKRMEAIWSPIFHPN